MCQEEGESDHYPPVIGAATLNKTRRRRPILHRREGYLIILVLPQTTNMASLYPRQGLLFIAVSSLAGTGALSRAIATGVR